MVFLLFLFCGHPGAFGDDTVSAATSGRAVRIDEPVFSGQIYFYDSGGTFEHTVLLLHGVGDEASDIWRGLAGQLENHYRVIYFDLPGFGRSDKGKKDYTLEKYAALVKWIYDQHVRGPMTVIGHSLGGAIALYYAGTNPESLERVVAVDAAGILHRTALMRSLAAAGLARRSENSLFQKQIEKLSDRVSAKVMVSSISRNAAGEKASRADQQMFRGKMPDTPQTAASLSLVSTDFSRILAQLQRPVRLIWGEKDKTAPLRTGKALAAMIPGAHLSIIPGAGHSPMMDRPNDFYKAVFSSLSESQDLAQSPLERWPGRKSISLSSKRNVLLRGEFNRIEIRNCRNIRLHDISARLIHIENSTVDMENFMLKTEHKALTLIQSTAVMTAGKIHATVAISMSGSFLDLAGVEIQAEKNAMESKDTSPSVAVFSLCRIQSQKQKGWLHDMAEITKDNPL